MPAYFIATPEEITDMDGMMRYAANAPAVVQAFGGKYLVPRGTARKLEGNWDPGFMVLIEFPSAERVLEFYESAEYRPWRELRQRAAKTSIVITES
jgi:uncharacterized protein (DUF1330 family)